MDAVLPAMIAVMFAEMGSKTQALAHAAAVQKGTALPVLIALGLTTILMLGIGAGGAIAVMDMLNPNAGTLLAGLALLFAGAPMLLPRKKAVVPSQRFLPGQFLVSQFGDASQFIVFAMAARSEAPVLTLIGGVFGVAAAMVPPMLMGKDWPGAVPVTALRLVAAIALIIFGVWMGLGALRLIA
jgi:putative Ca2+/H+ antiporter (TMEM165/GDT1 family)